MVEMGGAGGGAVVGRKSLEPVEWKVRFFILKVKVNL